MRIRYPLSLVLMLLVGCILSAAVSVVVAWTGPTQSAPNGNVSAPINVGSTNQVKNAGFGVNSLSVFGNALLSGFGAGVGRYLNFDYTSGGTSGTGSSGYGIRDNAGTVEFKNLSGSWLSLASAIQAFFASTSASTVDHIKFSDGTTQTTASAGGLTAVTVASCTWSGGPGTSCTASCPSGYLRTGASAVDSGLYTFPSSTQFSCGNSLLVGASGGTCYIFCAK